jgi:hypothetical protein
MLRLHAQVTDQVKWRRKHQQGDENEEPAQEHRPPGCFVDGVAEGFEHGGTSLTDIDEVAKLPACLFRARPVVDAYRLTASPRDGQQSGVQNAECVARIADTFL